MRIVSSLFLGSAIAGLLSFPFQIHAQDEAGTPWMSLFNGEDLTGWRGHTENWSVDTDSGMIVASGNFTGTNRFLVSEEKFTDFVFRVKARGLWEEGKFNNSGIQYRSNLLNDQTFLVSGMQYEIGTRWGNLYGEGGIQGPKFGASDSCLASIDSSGGWNQIEITADTTYLRHRLNGHVCGQTDSAIFFEGIFGFQYHASGGFGLNFKDVYIRPLNGSFAVPEGKAVYLDSNSTPVPKRQIKSSTALSYSMDMQDRKIRISLRVRHDSGKAAATLASLSGHVVDRQIISGSSFSMDIASLAAGVYFLSVDDGGSIRTIRLPILK